MENSLRTPLFQWLVRKLGVGEGEWGMGSEYQRFFLDHPITFLGLSNLIFTKMTTNNNDNYDDNN